MRIGSSFSESAIASHGERRIAEWRGSEKERAEGRCLISSSEHFWRWLSKLIPSPLDRVKSCARIPGLSREHQEVKALPSVNLSADKPHARVQSSLHQPSSSLFTLGQTLDVFWTSCTRASIPRRTKEKAKHIYEGVFVKLKRNRGLIRRAPQTIKNDGLFASFPFGRSEGAVRQTSRMDASQM